MRYRLLSTKGKTKRWTFSTDRAGQSICCSESDATKLCPQCKQAYTKATTAKTYKDACPVAVMRAAGNKSKPVAKVKTKAQRVAQAKERALLRRVQPLVEDGMKYGNSVLLQLAAAEVRRYVAEEKQDRGRLITRCLTSSTITSQFDREDLQSLDLVALQRLATVADEELDEMVAARRAGYPDYRPAPKGISIGLAKRQLNEQRERQRSR